MVPARRVFVLLGAYEDLTERETHALRRGDVDHAISLEGRKLRIAEAMRAARENAVLSNEDLDALTRRVRALEVCEKDNLAFLRDEMARTRSAIDGMSQAVHRTRRVRRGYAGAESAATVRAENVLGRA